MKATLTFDLDDVDDRAAHAQALGASRVLAEVVAFREWLRGQRKYVLSDEQLAFADVVWERLHECSEAMRLADEAG